MTRIEVLIEYRFEIPVEDDNLDAEFSKLKTIIETETEGFILRNKHTMLTDKKVLYEVIE